MPLSKNGRTVWRMPGMCANCPFATSGPGLALRKTLRRWPAILADLRRGAYFVCHKTAPETGDGSRLVCAGSLDWQESRGISSNYARVCERLERLAR